MVRKVRMWPVHGDQGRNQPVVQALEMSFRAFQVYFHYLQQQEAETLQIAHDECPFRNLNEYILLPHIGKDI